MRLGLEEGQVQDRWLDLRGLTFHYRDWGRSPSAVPMVLLHGLASQSHIFDLVAPRLAENFRVVALDQRGHGESAKPETGYDFENVCADLLAFIDALKFKRTFLVGHSWGGNVALQFAAQCPERTAALVLVDGGFLDIQARPEMTWERTANDLAPPKLSGMSVEQFKAMMRGFAGDVRKPTIEQVILQNFEILPDQTIRPRLSYERHMLILRALWEQRPPMLYPKIQCPVLMIPARSPMRGEQTFNDAKRAAVAAAKQALTRSEIVWFENTVHDIPLHRPRKLANTITHFARKYKLI